MFKNKEKVDIERAKDIDKAKVDKDKEGNKRKIINKKSRMPNREQRVYWTNIWRLRTNTSEIEIEIIIIYSILGWFA